MPFNHGKFGPAAGSKSEMPAAKEKPASMPHEKSDKGEQQAPHGQEPVKHVTETHPGETQPHPTTGVHAFHGHHVGGGKYKSHTHHDGGEVETKDHASADEMHSAGQEALPSDGAGAAPGQEQGKDDYSEVLNGVGGAMES